MNHNYRTPFLIGIVIAVIIALAGTFIDNNNLLAPGVALLGALFILAAIALAIFQHTELILSTNEPIPFKKLSKHTVIAAIIIAILVFIGGAALVYYASRVVAM